MGFAALLAVAVHLRTLRQQAADLGADRGRIADRAYLARAAVAWGWLFAVVAIGFVIQENIEHFIGHAHAPGIGALIGPEYPLALPMIAGISFAGALLVAAIGQRGESAPGVHRPGAARAARSLAAAAGPAAGPIDAPGSDPCSRGSGTRSSCIARDHLITRATGERGARNEQEQTKS